MGHIYRELNEIDIPDFAHINNSNGHVFVSTHEELKRNQMVIGLATSKTTMHPNENFKFHYPKLWREAYGQKTKIFPHELHAGLYGLFLSVGHATGLYPLLLRDFGPLYANAIMDYAMFSVHERTTASYLMSDFTEDQLVFSEKKYEDGWYSEFFESKLSEDAIHRFRTDWLEQCPARKNGKVWICVDGSNNNCEVQESDLAEEGNSKSRKAVPVCGYMWAVSATDGRPLTWFVSNGGKIDSKAFEKVEKFLSESNLEIKGFILDRGFATEEILHLIRSTGHHYVVMLRPNSFAYREMFEKHAEDIHWKVSRVVNRDGLFGVTDYMNVFCIDGEKAHVALYFNPSIGTKKYQEFIGPVFDAYRNVKEQLARGKNIESISIPSDVRQYITLSKDETGKGIVEFSDMAQKVIDRGGYSAIASSEDLSAGRISEIYDYRDVSEKQFSLLKSQLGADVTRVHDDARIRAKFAVCFIASIIRTEIEIACKELKIATNKMLRQLDRVVLALMPGEKYLAIHDMSERTRKLFSVFGLNDSHLDFFAEEINHRSNPIHSQTRSMPPLIPASRRRRGRPPKPKATEEESTPKRRPGRPAGSKNKKTLEREALEATMPPKEKRKPGRPKGSRNRKTVEREHLEQEKEVRLRKSQKVQSSTQKSTTNRADSAEITSFPRPDRLHWVPIGTGSNEETPDGADTSDG